MKLSLENVTPDIASAVLWEMDIHRPGAARAGKSTRHLILAIVTGSQLRRAEIARGLPGLVEAVEAVQCTELGAADLSAIAIGGGMRDRTTSDDVVGVDP